MKLLINCLLCKFLYKSLLINTCSCEAPSMLKWKFTIQGRQLHFDILPHASHLLPFQQSTSPCRSQSSFLLKCFLLAEISPHQKHSSFQNWPKKNLLTILCKLVSFLLFVDFTFFSLTILAITTVWWTACFVSLLQQKQRLKKKQEKHVIAAAYPWRNEESTGKGWGWLSQERVLHLHQVGRLN